MNKYENHEHEWRTEENRNRYIREQAKKIRYIDPRDPDYIAPDELEECQTCSGSGFSGYGTGYDAICDDCAGSGCEFPYDK